MKNSKLFYLVVRLVIGGIFLYAGIIKAIDPVGFAGKVAAYHLVPYFASFLVAAVVPWMEIICGAALIIGIRVQGAILLLFLLDIIFIAAIISVIVRGLDIDCGCFRLGGTPTSPWAALGRDICIFCGLAFMFAVQRGQIRSKW